MHFKGCPYINNKISKYLKSLGIKIEKYYISHHHYNSQSYFRKPNPGNFFKASNQFNFILDKTFYIGDDKRDIEAAYNSGSILVIVFRFFIKLNFDPSGIAILSV